MKSEKVYIWLCRILIAFLVLEIVVGLTIVFVCEYAKELVQRRIFKFEKQEILNVFFIVKLFGFHVSFYFLCGVPIVSFLDEVYTRHMGLLLKLWILFAFETAFGSIFINWCFNDAVKFLLESFENSLKKGIKLYPQDPTWVLVWDDMQYQFKCCGVNNHMDWTKVNLTSGKNVLKQSKEYAWLPFSCANGSISSNSTLVVDNVYTTGCFTVVSRIVNHLTSTMFSLNVTSVILFVFIVYMLRIVFAYKRVYHKDCEGDYLLSMTDEENENAAE